MNGFRVIMALAPGVYLIQYDAHRALWATKKLRKNTECAATKRPLKKGDTHYGPVGNQMYRYRRLHRQFVEGSLSGTRTVRRQTSVSSKHSHEREHHSERRNEEVGSHHRGRTKRRGMRANEHRS